MDTQDATKPAPFNGKGTSDQYDAEYYNHHCGSIPYDRDHPHWLRFFSNIADQIIGRLHPRRVLDVGCAKGFLVECLRDRGVDAYGFDVSEFAINEVRPDMQRYCWVATLAEPLSEKYDLITCIEVLEHVSEEEGREAIRNMTSHSDEVLFSSTATDFTEPTHVNVRPLIEWLRVFADFSFVPDAEFDASFIALHAVLFRRSAGPVSDEFLRVFARNRLQAIALYEKDLLLNQKDHELRMTAEQLRQTGELLAVSEATLQQLLNSKGWQMLERYREFRGSLRRLVSRPHSVPVSEYQRWVDLYEGPSKTSEQIAQIRQEIRSFSYARTISITMPVFNTPREHLEKSIASVRSQYYEEWQLCICDDHSSDSSIRPALEKWAARDARIKVTFSPENEGISGASNRALALASGEFAGLLDHDDELSPNALYENVKVLQQHPDAEMIYSDEDKLAADGSRCDPFFKPDWSPEYLLSYMYTCHFGVYRREIVNAVGGFRRGFEGSQDYDLVLRVTDKTDRVFHIPKILYHWRMAPGSAAAVAGAKTYAFTAAKKALSEHLQRAGTRGKVLEGAHLSHYRVKFDLAEAASVSIIVPYIDNADKLRRCLTSIQSLTDYANYEVLIVNTQNSDVLESLPNFKCRELQFSEAYNLPRLLNFAVKQSQSDFIIVLDSSTEVISDDWISSMLEYGQLKDVGVIGARLLSRDRQLQHIGLVLGLGGQPADSPLRGRPVEAHHYFDVGSDIRNCSAVSSACMMIRRNVFEQVGGFDDNLPRAYYDIDFCLRVRQAGYRVVYMPFSTLYCDIALPKTGSHPAEQDYMHKRWGDLLTRDPYYNPNLSLQRDDFGLKI